MIPWETTDSPRRDAEANITIGPCQLSVSSSDMSDKTWQWCMISVGEFTDQPYEECLACWPKRAVQLALKAIRRLEKRLEELDK